MLLNSDFASNFIFSLTCTLLQVSPIDIDAWMERKNSINKEVLKFQEELLNYEEDSLNPTAASTKVTPTNPVQGGANPSAFQNGFIPGRNNGQNLNDVLPKAKAISAKEKFFKSEPVGLLNRISDSANNNNRKGKQNTTDNAPSSEVLSRKERANVAYADKQIEEYEADMEKLMEENKTADVKLAEYEKGMRETEETKDDPELALLDLPRKKSVHFEGVSICLSEVRLAWRIHGTDTTTQQTRTQQTQAQYLPPLCFVEVRQCCFFQSLFSPNFL